MKPRKRRKVTRTGRKGPGAPCRSCEANKRAKGALDVRLANMSETGESIPRIAGEFKLTDYSVRSHYKAHLPDPLRVAVARHAALSEEIGDFDALASLKRMTTRAETMLEAAHEWLLDPDGSGKYNLNPRTHEVDVVYEEFDDEADRKVSRTAKLSQLLERVERQTGVTVIRGESKVADPRKLILDAVTALKPVVEMLGKACGQIRAEPSTLTMNMFFASPMWAEVEAVLVESLTPHPQALAAARGALSTKLVAA